MRNEAEKITVKYQTVKSVCHCCDRELDEPETGNVREFDFYFESLKEDNDWRLFDVDDELPEVVEGYVYNTVNFYAVSGYDELKFLDGEVDKILQYIKANLLKN